MGCSLNPRFEAIKAITGARHQLNRVNFKETHIKDLFGCNVFNEEEQRQRLPKPIFKALQRTIKQGAFWWGVVTAAVVGWVVLPYARSMTARPSSGG